MNNLIAIPRKIYYMKATGQFIYDTGQSMGTNTRETTIDEDFEIYVELSNYNKDAVGCIQLEIDQYKEEFDTSISFRVNLETKELEFSYREDEITNEPVYEKPLTVQLEELKQRQEATDNAILQLLMEGMM